MRAEGLEKMRTSVQRARRGEVTVDVERGAEEGVEGEGTADDTTDGMGRDVGDGPADDDEMDELMAAAAANTSTAQESSELEVEEWEEAMARDMDGEEWWRRPNRIDDG